ncbi:uncharacterized protein LOC126959066 isoform X1 [Macaca thibetana thibetana]|uniref:uncharacterized protein LOC126959066 isoform X1 n=2 Tax=Macaca thibetana thibetana TaxID=257877 RepID=UPI0021BCADF8|nr:uncharacterized protein LOC126959066 isoform X1 [Macaca thibetana thibetana]XP_050653978.1 uncharacterized protein LOC126959066 isoform X2 [Macaca thibetana thibetana]XP_050653979.1 uncharacterized protein LOC126959066 isoform X1 [Macaca thibetana thibetana]
MRTRVGPTVPGPGSISQVPSPCCTEALALPVTLVSCIELGELFHPGGPLASSGIDGEHRGRIALSPLALDQCLSITCSDSRVLKLRSFLSSWSPALSELFPPADPLGLTGIVSSSAQQTLGIDQHREGWAVGPMGSGCGDSRITPHSWP